MATTDKNNKDFITAVIGDGALDSAVKWIGDNLSPGDVFSEKDLCHYCQHNTDPDDVFTEKQLTEWAESNGFTKDED